MEEEEPVEKKSKAGAKMYKQAWVFGKLTEQQEKKRNSKRNRTGNAPGQEAATAGDGKKPTKRHGHGHGAGAAGHDDLHDLAPIIEELRNDLVWKDEEFREATVELDALRLEVASLRELHRKEKLVRQSLGADKLKQRMLDELMENAGTISKETFFDKQRREQQLGGAEDNPDGGNFLDRIKEQ